MSFDWGEYLSVAEELCSWPVSGPPAGTEAQQRAAVSRAYYAGFILARNHLRDVDRVSIPHTGSAHLFVAQRYASDPDLRRRQIGHLLRRLRSARNRCDYDDAVPHLPMLAAMSLMHAEQIVADLARL